MTGNNTITGDYDQLNTTPKVQNKNKTYTGVTQTWVQTTVPPSQA